VAGRLARQRHSSGLAIAASLGGAMALAGRRRAIRKMTPATVRILGLKKIQAIDESMRTIVIMLLYDPL
jgi:hypothetical protein